MRIKQIETKKVKPYFNNPRKNEHAIRVVARSIQEFGWQQPIVVDSEMTVIAGHTRLGAAILLGELKVPVTVAENLTAAQVRAYRLADNKVAEYSDWDEEKLIAELCSMQEGGEDLSLTGFDDQELEKLLADEVEGEAPPEVIFSRELLESHNYIVLVFDNDIDWLNAKGHFQLPSTYSKRANGKPWSKGIGRVLDGAEYLDRMKAEGLDE